MQINSLKNLSIPLWGLFIISLLGVLYLAKAVFIPVFLAVLAALALMPAVRQLEIWHIPRALGSTLILMIFSGLIVLAFNLLAEPASMWFERLPAEMRQIEQKVSVFKDSIENVQATTQRFEEIATINDDKVSQEVVVQGPNLLFRLLDGTQSLLLGVLSFVVLLFFLLAFGDSLARNVSRLWNSRSGRAAVIGIARETRIQISHYLLLVSVINLGLGVLAALLMWAVGMPNPLVWGATAALLNFIPYLGPAINLAIVTMVALLTFDSATRILLPPLLLLGLNILEGQFVQPLFVGRMFTMNPVVVFLSVLGWGWLWGVAGVFMAVPLLVMMRVVFDQSMAQWKPTDNQSIKEIKHV